LFRYTIAIETNLQSLIGLDLTTKGLNSTATNDSNGVSMNNDYIATITTPLEGK
jgi:hypothetical protein